jgi:AGZA family xanthine/uracil permease-like MFS transporter
VLAAAGTTAAQVGYDKIGAAGTVYEGTALLGGGAVLAGLVLGAIVAFVVDRSFIWAGGYCLLGAALSFVGLIHGIKVEWNANGQISLGYLFAGLIFLAFSLSKTAPPAEGLEATDSPAAEADLDASSEGKETVPVPRAAEETTAPA